MAKFDWEKEYEKKLKSGRLPSLMNPEGSMYAQDLRAAGGNIARGKASPLDYLTVALAPTALAGFGAARGARAAVNATSASSDLSRAYNQLAKTLAKPRVTHMTTMQGLEGIVGSGGQVKTALGDGVRKSPVSSGNFTVRNIVGADDPVYGIFTRGNPNIVRQANKENPTYVTRKATEARRATQLTEDSTANPILQYGDIGINFGPKVSRQSTATIGDSVSWAPLNKQTGKFIGQNAPAEFMPTTRLSPGASAADLRAAARTADAEDLTMPFFGRPLPYLEAQIPKQLATLQNAKSISVSTPQQAARVKELLRGAGINTKVIVRKTKTERQPLVDKALEALDKTVKQAGYKRGALQRKVNQVSGRNQRNRVIPEPEA